MKALAILQNEIRFVVSNPLFFRQNRRAHRLARPAGR
jgi:hypothetical protein